MNTDRIERKIQLKAPRSRVWRALTTAEEFGAWFGVRLEGEFTPGEVIRGNITTPGYEHLVAEITVDRIEPEHRFVFRWHPAAVDAGVDYSAEPPTQVEFRLVEVADGTELTITESGFDQIPLARRAGAYRMNDGGWAEQLRNIERYVAGT